MTDEKGPSSPEPQDILTVSDELIATGLTVQRPYSGEQIDERVNCALTEIWPFRHDDGAQQDLYESFRQELLAEKDRFDKVFLTSHDSTYFVTEDGVSLRFKRAEGNEPQELYRKILFLTDEETSHVLDLIKAGGTLNRVEPLSIQKSPYGVGKIVLELFILELDEPPFTEDENTLVVSNIPGGFHLGHPISEIIK